jgi:hypothetical protein
MEQTKRRKRKAGRNEGDAENRKQVKEYYETGQHVSQILHLHFSMLYTFKRQAVNVQRTTYNVQRNNRRVRENILAMEQP